MQHSIDPCNDFVFKYYLAGKGNDELMLHFLNAIIEPEHEITEIDINDHQALSQFEADKLASAELLATDCEGNSYQIQMQKAPPAYLGEQIVHSGSRLFCSKMNEGQVFSTLKCAHSIWILSENYFASDHCFRKGMIWDLAENAPISQKSLYHIVELAKWQPPSEPQDLMPRDIWMYLFTSGGKFNEIPQHVLTHPIMQKLREILLEISDNAENYAHYLTFEKAEHVRLTEISLKEQKQALREQERSLRKQVMAIRRQEQVRRTEEQERREEAERASLTEQALRQATERENELLRQKLIEAGIEPQI